MDLDSLLFSTGADEAPKPAATTDVTPIIITDVASSQLPSPSSSSTAAAAAAAVAALLGGPVAGNTNPIPLTDNALTVSRPAAGNREKLDETLKTIILVELKLNVLKIEVGVRSDAHVV